MDYMMRRRDQGPPSPFRERLRLAIILTGAGAGFFCLFRFQKNDIGGAARLALGVWLSVLGMVDMVWLQTGDLDRVWLKTRRGSTIAAVMYLGAGIILVLTGILGLT